MNKSFQEILSPEAAYTYYFLKVTLMLLKFFCKHMPTLLFLDLVITIQHAAWRKAFAEDTMAQPSCTGDSRVMEQHQLEIKMHWEHLRCSWPNSICYCTPHYLNLQMKSQIFTVYLATVIRPQHPKSHTRVSDVFFQEF